MAGNKDYNYQTLGESPYNGLLHRESDLTYQFGQDTPVGGQKGTGTGPVKGSGQDDGTTQSRGGSVATVALKSEGNATDVWIQNFIRSVNWKPKKVGFYINGQSGYAEFANVYVSGTIVVAAGNIGGFDIGPNYIRDHLNTMGMSSVVTGGDDVRFWAGDTFANRDIAPFRVYESGKIDAISGFIGGFELGSTYIRDAANSFGFSSVVGASEVRLWVGDTFANRAIAPFRTLADGSVVASNMTVNGTSAVDTAVLSGLVAQANLAYANQSWGQSCTFTAIDHDTVNWGAGTLAFSNGDEFTISSGGSGNMATAKVYVYFDHDISLTVYQQTALISDTVGPNKVVIAVLTRNADVTKKASYQLFGGGGGIVVDGGTLTPGSVTYTELAFPPLNGTADPAVTPGAIGQLYVNTLGERAFIAIGTNSDADWMLLASTKVARALSVSDTVTISENISITIAPDRPSVSDTVTVTENLNIVRI